jgi:predicted HAD superfamily Cof-like phosphohydrolase
MHFSFFWVDLRLNNDYMKQPQSLEMVAEFHRTFQHPILTSPSIPDARRARLRVDLIAEELREFEEAIQQGDIVGVADALCDIQYVLSGAVLEFGLADKFLALFEEVQRSNMSKACNSEEEAVETVDYYQREKGVVCYYEKVGDKWLVYRKQDNKTIKSVGYSPADLKSILDKS